MSTNGHPEPEQDDDHADGDAALVLAVARGWPRARVARECHVSPRTVSRRLADPAFLARVRELRSGMLDEAIGKLTAIANRASAELGKLVRSNNEAIRLGAIRLVLDSLLKLRDHAELVGRIEALEGQADGTARRAR
jgi:hypothetical protein